MQSFDSISKNAVLSQHGIKRGYNQPNMYISIYHSERLVTIMNGKKIESIR